MSFAKDDYVSVTFLDNEEPGDPSQDTVDFGTVIREDHDGKVFVRFDKINGPITVLVDPTANKVEKVRKPK